MQARLTLSLALSSLLVAACSSSSNSPRAAAAPPAVNTSGSPVTGVLTARFDPTAGKIPTPNNLLFSGTRDLTINIPVANPNNTGDPQVAINTLDGWSTTAPWTMQFQGGASVDAATVVAGQSVRMFEVTLSGPGGAVTGIVRELTPGAEFATAVTTVDARDANGAPSQGVAVVPTSPLKQLTSYMVVMTNAVRDARGNDATPDQTYFLAKRTRPLCVNGQSTDRLLPASTACALEPLRLLTNSHLAAAASRGIDPARVVVSWVATTQSITPVMQAVAARTQAQPPAPVVLQPTGLTTAAIGRQGIADIYVGFIALPYYLVPPSAQNPTAPLTGFWKAAPGAYNPPFNALGLDPTSTHLTAYNPFPVANATVRVPVLMTVPNEASGRTRPATGWPIVIYQHGITRNRTDGLAIAETLAAQGFAMVSIDQPLHGISPGDTSTFTSIRPFYVSAANPLMAPLAAAGVRERTFDLDLQNNSTGAPGPDGIPEGSGTYTINLASLLTSRDNVRQAVADLLVLRRSIQVMDINGDGTGDFNPTQVRFVGQSLGAIVGQQFVALDPVVDTALLSVPGGQIAYLLNGSPTFGPRIRAGLAAAGLQAGTPDFNRFLGATQQVIDSADPINYGFASAQNKILLHEVVGGGGILPDQVIPNAVAGAPLAGTEPLIRVLGLAPITATTQATTGIRGAVRFIAGEHGSLLSPARSAINPPASPDGFLQVTREMQFQMASFLLSSGTQVVVQNPTVIRTQ